VGFYSKEAHHASCDDLGSVSGGRELELFHHIIHLLLQLN
jgi:hypothetical protein